MASRQRCFLGRKIAAPARHEAEQRDRSWSARKGGTWHRATILFIYTVFSGRLATLSRSPGCKIRPFPNLSHPSLAAALAATQALNRRLKPKRLRRPSDQMARALIGATLAGERRGRPHRRDRGVRSRRPRVSQLCRPDAAQPGHVRPTRPGLRLPLLRHSLVPEFRVPRRRPWRRCADPRARAAARHRHDAPAPRNGRTQAAVLRAGSSRTGAGHHARPEWQDGWTSRPSRCSLPPSVCRSPPARASAFRKPWKCTGASDWRDRVFSAVGLREPTSTQSHIRVMPDALRRRTAGALAGSSSPRRCSLLPKRCISCVGLPLHEPSPLPAPRVKAWNGLQDLTGVASSRRTR